MTVTLDDKNVKSREEGGDPTILAQSLLVIFRSRPVSEISQSYDADLEHVDSQVRRNITRAKNWAPYLNYSSIRTDCLGINPICGIKCPTFHPVFMNYKYTQETIYAFSVLNWN